MPWQNVMPQWKAGTLHSGGPSGPMVHNQKQAIAIMLSEKKKHTHAAKSLGKKAKKHGDKENKVETKTDKKNEP